MSTAVTEPSGQVPADPSPLRRLSPRKRRRIALTAQYVIFVAVVAVVIFVINWGDIQKYFLDTRAMRQLWPKVLTVGLLNTIIYALAGYVLAFALGLVVALMRLSSVAPYRWVALIYIEIFRGLPLLLVLLIIAFGLPVAFPGLEFPYGHYGSGAVGLALVYAAYTAETLRAGIQAVPKGQVEAARSLGMSQARSTVTIVLPQAFRIVIPPLTNELVSIFKDSSLVSAIGVIASEIELTKMGSDAAINSANSTPFVVAGVCYLIITVPLGIFVRRLEARQARRR
jgi:polar amino acid transport system permease protein